MILYDDFICQTGFFDILHTLQGGIHHIYFSTGLIKMLSGYPDDQVVAESFCSLEQIVVTLVEEVEGAIGDYFCHLCYPTLGILYNIPWKFKRYFLVSLFFILYNSRI